LFVSTKRLQDKGHKPENLSWVRIPVKMISVARKLSTIEERNQQFCFVKEITGAKVTNPKTVLGSSPGEDVEFRNNNFSYDIQQYVSDDEAYDKLSDDKD
jgi:hypothetical protein